MQHNCSKINIKTSLQSSQVNEIWHTEVEIKSNFHLLLIYTHLVQCTIMPRAQNNYDNHHPPSFTNTPFTWWSKHEANLFASSSETCRSWNLWVHVSTQILTKNPLSVRVRNKRKILDLRPSASALNRPASSH